MLVSLYDVISCDVTNIKNFLEILVFLLNSGYAPWEPCYIENPGIFRTQDISEIYHGILWHIHNAV